MAEDLNISDRSICRILKNDLKVKPYKIQKAHDLTPKQQQVRLQRAKEMLRRAESGKFSNIVFSDEKIFTTKQYVNSQNDRVYLTERSDKNLSHRLATRRQHPPQIMVWPAVTADGRPPNVFIEPGVKYEELDLPEWLGLLDDGVCWHILENSEEDTRSKELPPVTGEP
ncbi:uncharacterized protein LOC113375129 [Ctenocephalides felis]|uniref:uncharacterized protein LOC113375129 n=1 Tax=Ctenocephalides felis TaxID=7515 RepID=UPI000E6E4D36|nr:uncharacterized protein LOC113375129 [Ctenocephalides felis]